MMKPLVHRITDDLEDASKLEELLPELVSSTDHLMNAFIRAAAHGYIDSYNLLVPEVFNVAEKHYRDIPQAIFFVAAARKELMANNILLDLENYEKISYDLLDRVSDVSRSPSLSAHGRNSILGRVMGPTLA